MSYKGTHRLPPEKYKRYYDENFSSSIEGDCEEQSNGKMTGQTMMVKRRENNRKYSRHGDQSFLKVKKPVMYIFLAIIFLLFLLLVIDIKLKLENRNFIIQKQQRGDTTQEETFRSFNCKDFIYCPNVLFSAMNGYWTKQDRKVTTKWKEHTIDEIRDRMKLPRNMSRNDYRCGLQFPIAETRLAAYCNPNSIDYCCNEETGFCGNTTAHCQNKMSLNLRDTIPKSEALWIVNSTQCDLKRFSHQHACQILGKTVKKLVFIGDSQARQFFTTFILYLTNQYGVGAIKSDYVKNKDIISSCSNDYQILNNDCRNYLVKNSNELRNFCTGEDFEIEYFPDFYSFVSEKTAKMYRKLYDVANTYIVVGTGTHFNSNYDTFLTYYLKFMISEKKGRKWPHYIVETLHDVYSRASNEKRRDFNEAIIKYVKSVKSDVFDNTHLSNRLESFDGRTYGIKFQMLKVDILMHYFYNKGSCRK